jgi:hypothetical protein
MLRWPCEFVPAHAMRTRTNGPYAKVSVGQRRLTGSPLAISAAADRLRKACAGARLRRCLACAIASARTCRACARAEMTRLTPEAHRAMLQIWLKGMLPRPC